MPEKTSKNSKIGLGNIFASPVESPFVESGQDFLSEVKIDPDYYDQIRDETDAVYSTYPSGTTETPIINESLGLDSEPSPVGGNVLRITRDVSVMGEWLEFERNQKAA